MMDDDQFKHHNGRCAIIDEPKMLADILTNEQLEIIKRSMVGLFDASIAAINSVVGVLMPLYPQLMAWERRRVLAKYRHEWKRGKSND